MEIRENIVSYLGQIRKQKRSKTRIDIVLLEQELMEQYESKNEYNFYGGYKSFYKVIKELENKGELIPFKNKDTNFRNPPLVRKYWVSPEKQEDGWVYNEILKLSKHIDMSQYVRNKSIQTENDLEKLRIIYDFKENWKNDDWMSVEERSLELFRDEKWLGLEGTTLLNRVGLSFLDLGAVKHHRPFVYWQNPFYKRDGKDVFEVLIVEGLSTFHTLKWLISNKFEWSFGEMPYMLIFGSGNEITGNFESINDIFETNSNLSITYCGDIDPSGYSIYVQLKEKYSDFNIQLNIPMYEEMLKRQLSYPIETKQYPDETHFEIFLMDAAESEIIQNECRKLWSLKLRVPQEVLNREYLKGVMGDGSEH